MNQNTEFEEKIISNKNIREYFLSEKKYERTGFFKSSFLYCKNKIKRLFKSGCFTKTYVFLNVFLFSFNYLINSVIEHKFNIFGFDMGAFFHPIMFVFCMFSILLMGFSAFKFFDISYYPSEEEEKKEYNCIYIFFCFLSFLMIDLYHFFYSNIHNILPKTIVDVFFDIGVLGLNMFLIMAFLYIPYSFFVSLKNILKKNGQNINMDVFMEMKDHEFLSKKLNKEEFKKFISKYKKVSDLPLKEMMKIHNNKDKVENYVKYFYPSEESKKNGLKNTHSNLEDEKLL